MSRGDLNTELLIHWFKDKSIVSGLIDQTPLLAASATKPYTRQKTNSHNSEMFCNIRKFGPRKYYGFFWNFIFFSENFIFFCPKFHICFTKISFFPENYKLLLDFKIPVFFGWYLNKIIRISFSKGALTCCCCCCLTMFHK